MAAARYPQEERIACRASESLRWGKHRPTPPGFVEKHILWNSVQSSHWRVDSILTHLREEGRKKPNGRLMLGDAHTPPPPGVFIRLAKRKRRRGLSTRDWRGGTARPRWLRSAAGNHTVHSGWGRGDWGRCRRCSSTAFPRPPPGLRWASQSYCPGLWRGGRRRGGGQDTGAEEVFEMQATYIKLSWGEAGILDIEKIEDHHPENNASSHQETVLGVTLRSLCLCFTTNLLHSKLCSRKLINS